ncbi:MAG: chorismate mutase [Gemmatimonadaceae bacterium]
MREPGLDGECSLDLVRAELDRVDVQFIDLLKRRLELGVEAGRIKRKLGVPVEDSARENRAVAQARSWAANAGLSEKEVEGIFRSLIALSRGAQQSQT